MIVSRWLTIIPYAIIFVVGGASNLSFAPCHYYFVNFLALAGLLAYCVYASSAWSAFKLGFIYGLGLFGVGTSWVFISLYDYGEINIVLSLCLTGLFLICLALLIGCVTGLLKRLSPQALGLKHCCIVFPVLWVLFEWVRSWLFTGFPWLFLGYSLPGTPLAGWLPIVGVYGGSLIVCIIAGALFGLFYLTRNSQRWICVLLIIALMLAGWFLQAIDWTQPTNKQLKVSLVQGNIAQTTKWQPSQIKTTAQHYIHMTQQQWSSSLIIWPENALPLPRYWAQSILTPLKRQAQKHHSTVYVGLPMAASQPNRFYNSILALGAHGQQHYHKRHLVMFGEYIPLSNWLSPWIHFPFAQFQSGTSDQALLTQQGLKIAPFICYEIAFPHLVNQTSPQSNILLVTSDDAWFGQSLAPWQHLQIAQTQAVINGKPVMFATNNGITAFINKKGQIVTSLPQNTRAVLTHTVQPFSGKTPWNRWGDKPLIVLALISLIILQQKVILRASRLVKTWFRL